MVETTTVGRKLREQIHDFSGRLSTRFSRPVARFVEEMVYGIQAMESVRLSEISRSLEEGISLAKTETRLSRNLDHGGLGEGIREGVIELGAARVHADTLLIIDPTDLTKAYAKKMEYLGQVWDGSRKEIRDGYSMYTVSACDRGKHRVMPLYQALVSALAPDFVSDNDQVLRAVDGVRAQTKDRGIWVMDRGGDRGLLLKPFMDRGMRFIVRMRGDRHVIYRGRSREMWSVAEGCPLPYAETIVRVDEGKEKVYTLSYGYRPVGLPGREEELYLVVVTGLGREPLLLLTNLPMRKNRHVLWEVVEAYLTRWRVEDTIRFVKQSYHLEDIRVLRYRRLQNLVALVLAASYFAAVHLGQRLRISVLADRVLKASKRIFGIPAFQCYAMADGIAAVLRRTGQGPLCHLLRAKPPPVTMQLSLKGF
jgi:hypothetical protein